jgi:undecaprenyl-diphosphatase
VRRTWDRRRLSLLLGGVIAPFLLFLVLSEDVMEQETLRLDDGMLLLIETLHTAWATTLMRAVTFFGSFLGAGILTLALLATLLLLHRRRDAFFALVVMGGGGILQYLAKLFFDRPRPAVFPHLTDTMTSSFPSGHAMMSTCLALTAAIVFRDSRWRWPALAAGIVYALAVSFSRLYLGVHYPTDVLGGWLLACSWVSLVLLGFTLTGRRVPALPAEGVEDIVDAVAQEGL